MQRNNRGVSFGERLIFPPAMCLYIYSYYATSLRFPTSKVATVDGLLIAPSLFDRHFVISDFCCSTFLITSYI